MARLITLRRADVCCVCGSTVEAATPAWWAAVTRTVTCVSCFARDLHGERITGVIPRQPDTAPERTRPIDPGRVGRSTRLEYEHRHAGRDDRADRSGDRFAGVVKLLSDDPRRTLAWRKGSAGERRLAEYLAGELAEIAVLLHDRKAPGTRGSIDHLVVASSGVWVVDAKSYHGRVERRDVDGWLRTDVRLYVGGRNRSKAVAELTWQANAVHAALDAVALDVVPVHPALCFTDSEWGSFARPMRFDVVWVTWAQHLVELIATPGPLDLAMIEAVARRLGSAMPPG